MKVTYDLPPDIVSAVEGLAGIVGITVDEYVAERLRSTAITHTVRQTVKELAEGGMPDADIAATLLHSPGAVAAIRRSMGIPANRRYRKSEKKEVF